MIEPAEANMRRRFQALGRSLHDPKTFLAGINIAVLQTIEQALSEASAANYPCRMLPIRCRFWRRRGKSCIKSPSSSKY
jgi:hypothetical protein